MELISILLFVYAGLLLINAVFSAYCYRCYHDKLYRYALYLWIATFGGTLAQGCFQSTRIAMILSFSTFFLSSLALVQILAFVRRTPVAVRKYALFMAGCITCSIALDRLGAGFTAAALPASIGVATPMIHVAIKALVGSRSRHQRREIRGYCFLLLAYSLHMLDYPFLRLHPTLGVAGFTIALGMLAAFSVYLPSFIIRDITGRYADNVSELNDKLVEYQSKLAEVMSLAQVGELSFGFVHDMASPMTLLLHYSKEIAAIHGKGMPSNDKILPYSKGIERATERLVDLQNMFRSLLKKDVAEKPAPVDLRRSVQNCADLYRPFLEKQEIELDVELSGEDSTLQLRPGIIERTVLNLLQNAANALARHPSRKISIRLETAGDACVVSIQDSGPGLPAERLGRLWERFGHSETAKGSGFGLYKVKQLVDALHGRIDVETGERGTTFTIRIPRSAAAGTAANAATADAVVA